MLHVRNMVTIGLRLSIIKLLFLCAVIIIFGAGCGSGGGGGGTDPASSSGIVLAESRLGTSGGFVDVNGDGIEDLVVGAPEASGSPKKGAVLAYFGTADGIATSASWDWMGEQKGDNLGFSFANLGDVDGDGATDFATGAIYAEGNSPFSGAVYVYQGGQDSPELLVRLKGDQAHDRFGYAIAGADLNADGYNDIIVSALHARGNAFQSGIVYIFFGGTDIANAPNVTLKGDHANHGMGFCLDTGDINGDGISDLFVGGGDSVLIYYGRGNFAEHFAAVSNPDVTISGKSASGGGHSGSGFGDYITFIGDLNDDGFGDVVIANPKRTGPSVYDNIGSVYIFGGAADLPMEFYESDLRYKLGKINGDSAGDRFGSSIAVVNDINGGGKPDMLVGAPWATGGKSNMTPVAGKIYLFYTENLLSNPGEDLDTSIAAKVYTGDTSMGEYSKALSANADGKFFAGAPCISDNSGMAYIFDIYTDGCTEIGNN
jgi:hypothetical protein